MKESDVAWRVCIGGFIRWLQRHETKCAALSVHQHYGSFVLVVTNVGAGENRQAAILEVELEAMLTHTATTNHEIEPIERHKLGKCIGIKGFLFVWLRMIARGGALSGTFGFDA